MTNSNEITVNPDKSQGETLEIGPDVEVYREDSTGNIKLVSSNGQVVTDEDVTVNGTTTTDALEAAAATIGDHDTINGVETRTISINLPNASTNDDWSDFKTAATTIQFNTSFGSAPDVVIDQFPTGGVILTVSSVTTTSFDLIALNYTSTDKSSESADVSFIAVDS